MRMRLRLWVWDWDYWDAVFLLKLELLLDLESEIQDFRIPNLVEICWLLNKGPRLTDQELCLCLDIWDCLPISLSLSTLNKHQARQLPRWLVDKAASPLAIWQNENSRTFSTTSLLSFLGVQRPASFCRLLRRKFKGASRMPSARRWNRLRAVCSNWCSGISGSLLPATQRISSVCPRLCSMSCLRNCCLLPSRLASKQMVALAQGFHCRCKTKKQELTCSVCSCHWQMHRRRPRLSCRATQTSFWLWLAKGECSSIQLRGAKIATPSSSVCRMQRQTGWSGQPNQWTTSSLTISSSGSTRFSSWTLTVNGPLWSNSQPMTWCVRRCSAGGMRSMVQSLCNLVWSGRSLQLWRSFPDARLYGMGAWGRGG